MNPALLSSKNMNWETPDELLDLIRQLDVIGLDPATTKANPTGAKLIYTPEEDGLVLPWTSNGLVYCNPPYGREVKKWVQKASVEAARGAEIIMLLPARPDTSWCQKWVFGTADSVLFWSGRLTFKGAPHPAPFPSMLAYWGKRKSSFKACFIKHAKSCPV